MHTKWRVAKSLLALRNQVNEKFPNRNKDWDGTIGDARHSARTSDHNPDSDGVVKAMDITHDPKHGVDSYKLAEELRQSRDPRIKYIISNRRIASSTTAPWKWRTYTGNPHDHHVHVSVNKQQRYYDDDAPWEIPMLGKVPSEADEPEVAQEEGDDEQQRGLGIADIAGNVGTVAETVGTITTQVKPLYKSRIAGGAVALGASSTATAIAAAPPSLWEQFINVWKSPIWWLVVINVALTGYILWHYYSDHGRGALRKQQQ